MIIFDIFKSLRFFVVWMKMKSKDKTLDFLGTHSAYLVRVCAFFATAVSYKLTCLGMYYKILILKITLPEIFF